MGNTITEDYIPPLFTTLMNLKSKDFVIDHHVRKFFKPVELTGGAKCYIEVDRYT